MKNLAIRQETTSILYASHPAEKHITIAIAGKESNHIPYTQPYEIIRKHEKDCIRSYTGIDQEKIFFLNQIHTDITLPVTESSFPATLDAGSGDALVTNVQGYCLAIRTADCIPVMLYDMTQKCIAAVHSGWRGTVKDITAKTIHLMCRTYTCTPANIHAIILPGIGQESYEVSEDVALKFPDCAHNRDTQCTVSLQKAIMHSLLREGIHTEHIFCSIVDTFRDTHRFFSHRRGDTGRNINFIYMHTSPPSS